METIPESEISVTLPTTATEVVSKAKATPFIKVIRVFLLILIVIGVGLLATQSFWVPKLVTAILGQVPVSAQSVTVTTSASSPVLSTKIDQASLTSYGTTTLSGTVTGEGISIVKVGIREVNTRAAFYRSSINVVNGRWSDVPTQISPGTYTVDLSVAGNVVSEDTLVVHPDSSASITASMDKGSLTAKSGKVLLSGDANSDSVSVSIQSTVKIDGGTTTDKGYWEFQKIPVKNGKWSVNVPQVTLPGNYVVRVYQGNSNVQEHLDSEPLVVTP
jgi:hypothetical protein